MTKDRNLTVEERALMAGLFANRHHVAVTVNGRQPLTDKTRSIYSKNKTMTASNGLSLCGAGA